jgi:hypothetical protein
VATLYPKNKPASFDPTIRNPLFELRTYRVTANLVKVRWVNDKPTATEKGGDLDIHLVIASPSDTSKTMVVEFPFPNCTHASKKLKAKMVKARKDFLADCFHPSETFQDLQGTATVTGVGFYDRPHASGAALHGVELHPVIAFSSSDCAAGP